MKACEECNETRQGTPYRVKAYLVGAVRPAKGNAVLYSTIVYLCALCAGMPGESTAND